MKCFLVMDMPESCFGCNFMHCDEEHETETCQATEVAKDIDLIADRPDWCPLRELPEKMETGTGWYGEKMFRLGFNACLDEIIGRNADEK